MREQLVEGDPVTVQQMDLSEFPGVPQHQSVPVQKVHLEMGMPIRGVLARPLQTRQGAAQKSSVIDALRIPKRQLAGHPKMDNEVSPVQVEHQKLPPSPQSVHDLARQFGLEAGWVRLEDLAVSHLDPVDPETENAREQTTTNRLDFR